MRRLLSLLLGLCLVGAGMPSVGSANEARDFFRGLLNEFQGDIIDGVRNSIDRKKAERERKQAIKQSLQYGFCQVWRNEKLAVQKKCTTTNDCMISENCVMNFKWPTGGTTKVQYAGRYPATLNGKPTEYISIGPDQCFMDGNPSHLFCFTSEPQPANLYAVYNQPSDTNELAYSEPIPSDEAPKIIKEPMEQELTSTSTDFESIVNQYADAMENQADSGAKEIRCKLGAKLLLEYKADLEADIQHMIKQQIADDQCFG